MEELPRSFSQFPIPSSTLTPYGSHFALSDVEQLSRVREFRMSICQTGAYGDSNTAGGSVNKDCAGALIGDVPI